MVRTPCCDQSGLKKGTWTPEEDRKLVAYVTRYGCWNWRQLPKFAGLARCGKSCRLRWLNYLRPDIKRGNYTQQEEDTITRLHQKLGNRWSKIAAHLPGRTDNEIKNHWHTNLKKHFQVQQQSHTHGKAKVFKPKDGQTQFDSMRDTNSTTDASQCASAAVSNSQISDIFSMFCTDTGASSSTTENMVVEDYDDLAFGDALIEPTTENFWTEPYMVDISYVPNEALVPLSAELTEYFSSVCDAQLWGHNNLHDGYTGLF